MHYIRGHSRDFDEWEQLGNPGWSWAEVRKAYHEVERFTGDGKGNEGVYGVSGKLAVEKGRFR